jgi:diguanylate cyclase (GGDEF)-like protein/PAS domain S-box-containing protein
VCGGRNAPGVPMATRNSARDLLADIGALRGIIDAVPNAVFVKDRDSRFLVVNDTMCRLMGRPFEELVGRLDSDFVPAEQAAVFRAVDLRILDTGEPNENEEHITDGSGDVRTIITRKQALDLADGTRVIVGCITDITEFRRAEQMVRYNAEHDHLTGLANRALFQRHLRESILQLRPGGESIALLLIDLDGFKGVNDTHGHAAGDAVLCAVADSLRAGLRPTDLIARVGGDEFVALFPHTDRESAGHALERVRATLAIDERSRGVGFSAGITQLHDSIGSIDDVLGAADQQMYEVKAAKRGAGAAPPIVAAPA